MNNRHPLKSLSFLVSLALLLLNDFVLKTIFHNWITGKISDFSGLFVFAIFFLTLFPWLKQEVIITIALGFIFWKSASSQAFITFWSQYFFMINRTVDYTDLLALIVLPYAYSFFKNKAVKPKTNYSTIIIIVISLFSFCATSMKFHTYTYNDRYYFTSTQDQLLSFLSHQGNVISKEKSDNDVLENIRFYFDPNQYITQDSSEVELLVMQTQNGSVLVLKNLLIPSSISYVNNDHHLFESLLMNNKELGFIRKEERSSIYSVLDNLDYFGKLSYTLMFIGILCLLLFVSTFIYKEKSIFRVSNALLIFALIFSCMFILRGLPAVFLVVISSFSLYAFYLTFIRKDDGSTFQKVLSIYSMLCAGFLILMWSW
jgi:hypothetical protein